MTLNLPGFELETLDKVNEQEEVLTEEKTVETPVEKNETLSTWYEYAKEEGLLLVDDTFEFDGTPESFQKAQELHKQKYQDQLQQQILSSIAEKNRKVVEAALQGLDIDPIFQLKKESENLPDISLIDGQKQALTTYYSKKGLDKIEIDELLKTYEENGSLEEKAKKAYPILEKALDAEIERQRKLQEDNFKAQQEQTQQFANSINEQLKNRSKGDVQRITAELYTQSNNEPLIVNKINSILANPELIIHLAEFLSYFDGKKLDVNKYKKVSVQTNQQVRNSMEKLMSKKPIGGQDPNEKIDDFMSFSLVD